MGVHWKISLKKATVIVLCVCAVVLYLIWQNALVMFDVKETKIESFQRLSNAMYPTKTSNIIKEHHNSLSKSTEDDSIPYEVEEPVKKSVKETQKFRQQRMRHACQYHYKIQPLNLNRESSNVVSLLHSRLNMTYFNDYFNFTIAIVYKVGSTSWRDTIINVYEFASWEYRKTHKNPLVTLLGEFEKSPREIVKRLTNFTNFIFVRHPFSRLVSAYTDKFVNLNFLTREYYGKKARVIIETLRGAPPKDGIEPNVRFDEFVKFITDDHLFPNKMNKDGHWEPYFNTYKPCEYYFDFIGHMETLIDDLDYLSNLLKAEEFLNHPHKNPTKYSNKPKMKEYFSQVSDELFKKVVQKYEDDLRVFGYAIPHSVDDL